MMNVKRTRKYTLFMALTILCNVPMVLPSSGAAQQAAPAAPTTAPTATAPQPPPANPPAPGFFQGLKNIFNSFFATAQPYMTKENFFKFGLPVIIGTIWYQMSKKAKKEKKKEKTEENKKEKDALEQQRKIAERKRQELREREQEALKKKVQEASQPVPTPAKAEPAPFHGRAVWRNAAWMKKHYSPRRCRR